VTVAGLVAAVGGMWCLLTDRPKAAGALMIASSFTPTYAMWALNVVPVIVGVVLLVTPRVGAVDGPVSAARGR
jgi:hypothetical protein